MKKLITLFLLILLVGVAFGAGRDLYSTEVRTVKGTVVAFEPVGQDYKSQVMRTPMYRVKLDDGQEIDAATTDSAGLAAGSPIDVIELQAPWGQAWFKKSG